MNLKQIYATKSLEELIRVLENSDEYTSECVDVVLKEFNSREFDPKIAKEFAKKYYREKLRETFADTNFMQTTIKIPKSHTLDKKEAKSIYLEELSNWKQFKETTQDGAKRFGMDAQ